MFDLIFEGRLSVYLLIGAVGVVFWLAWYRNQKRRELLVGVYGALVAAALYAALDWSVETGREQVRRKVEAMAAAVGRNDLDAAFRHISEQFVSPGGRNKTQFKGLAVQHRNAEEVTDVVVWDFVYPEPFDPEKGKGRVSFLVKARGNLGRAQHLFARCDAVFVHDAREGWQLQSFELFEPHTEDSRTPFPF